MNDRGGLRAGAAEAVIPSEAGLDLAGFVARDNPSGGKRDEIYARALALEAGGHLLVLLSADVLGFESAFVAGVRDDITRRAGEIGLRPAALHVTVAATHTHSAPASQPLRGCGDVDPAWLQTAGAVLADTAMEALGRLRPARLGSGSGAAGGVAGNRRTPGWTRGASAPASEDFASGPVDPEVGVLRVETADGAPLACLVNFTCHPVILGPDSRDISADYAGLVAKRLGGRLGAVTLFTNGAAGDINPVRRGSWADVERVAGAVADEAERVWAATRTRGDVALSAGARTLSLPLLPLPPRGELEDRAEGFRREQEAARQAGRGSQKRTANAYREWAEDALARGTEPLRVPAQIQALHIGDAALVAVPGELFVALGLRIKGRLAALGVRPAWVLGYTNGNVGYVPTRAAYEQGGYEVETAHRFYGQPSCVAPEAGEMIVESAVALAARGG